jgi:segregation and condensation protein A
MDTMTVSVAVESFEGPLGLLLELVEGGQIEVTTISMAAITKSYLGRINELAGRNADELSEFIQLGCRLVYIKSLALLPQSDAAEQGEELRQLNIELEEYRRYQKAAESLARKSNHRTWQRRAVTKLSVEELPMPTIDLMKLQDAFTRAMQRAAPIMPQGSITAHISQAEITKHIINRLKQGSFQLEALLAETKLRIEIIVTFLALLELIKTQAVRVTQATQFEPIMVEAFHG